ncbi:MAG: His/Gly/Thr/Pro-type tRNA ligase C-terminal domain-containing protein [Alphaproteobacteria bacterium]
MEYANKIQIPYLIIIGEDEAAAGDYTLKNMVTGEQKRLSLEQVSAEIKADA